MSRFLAFTFVRLVVALIVLECILAAFLPIRPPQSTRTHFSEKTFSAVLWTAFVTGQEGEKAEGFSDNGFTVRITDLHHHIYLLSRVHATLTQPRYLNYHPNDHFSSILVLLCTLII